MGLFPLWARRVFHNELALLAEGGAEEMPFGLCLWGYTREQGKVLYWNIDNDSQ